MAKSRLHKRAAETESGATPASGQGAAQAATPALAGWLPRVRRECASVAPLTLYAYGVVSSIALVALFATLGARVGLLRPAAPVLLLLITAAFAWPLAVPRARERLAHLPAWDKTAIGLVVFMALITAIHLHASFAVYDTDVYLGTAAWAGLTGQSAWPAGPYDHTVPSFHLNGGAITSSGAPGYAMFLAAFASVFGPWNALWGNVVLIAGGLLAFARIADHLVGKWFAVAGLGLLCVSFFTMWYARWGMSENLAFALFWGGALAIASPGSVRVRGAVLAVCLAGLSAARPEGLFVAIWMGLVAVFAQAGSPRQRIALAFGVTGAGLAAALLVPRAYIAGGISRVQELLRFRPVADEAAVPVTGPGPNWGDYAWRYVADSWNAYGLGWILLGILVTLFALRGWRRLAITAALAAPYLVFLAMPPITTGHPWFMRRYWVALLPLMFLALAAGTHMLAQRSWRRPLQGRLRLGQAGARWIAVAVVTAAILGQGVASLPHVGHRADDGVRAQVEGVLAHVPAHANLVLDQDATVASTWFRVLHGPTVAVAHSDLSLAQHLELWTSIPGPVYVLRGPGDPALHLAASPILEHVTTVRFHQQDLTSSRTDHKLYIAFPPLAQGYDPLATYLRDQVPPRGWSAHEGSVDLYRTGGGLRPLYGIELGTGWTDAATAWTSEAGASLQGRDDFAGLRERFPEHVLHVAYEQGAAWTLRADNVTVFEADAGPAGVRVATIPLPRPDATLTFDAGARLRGAMLAPAAFG